MDSEHYFYIYYENKVYPMYSKVLPVFDLT